LAPSQLLDKDRAGPALAKILVEEFIVKERLERVRDEVTLPSERRKGRRGTGKARPLP
jgi:hypothetical protein